MSKKEQKNQKIQVFARCRPLNSIETKQCSPSVVEVIPEKKEIVLKVGNTSREFSFDKVFPPNTQQIAVYKAVVGPLIQEVLMGYNCTVFAYGQTGTGKTYTMEGERNNSKCSWEADPGAGIIPRSLHQLFEELNKEENVEFSVRVSFLELYNEELFDLLGSTELSAERTKLRLYEDTNRKGSVIIQGLEEVLVNNKDEVYNILEKGTARRQTAATMLNASSSRSHTVFSVTVHIKENTVEGEELLKTGKLNLVDLAGSENVGRSGAINNRAREAGNINQSLLTLGRVITALIEKQPHVPYRESKLTRLLQDSLGGHTKTSIIATISPAQCNFDETISTLDYATKAKSITIKPEVNQKMTKRALIREYTEEIERLRKDLAAIRSSQGFYIDADNYKSLTDKIEHLTTERTKVEEMFTTTKEELEKTQQQYIETEQKYSETKEVLNYTQEVLTKTTLERDEKEYLINYQKSKEKQLLLQTKTLLKVADQTTDETNKLHSKIERKTGVERTNEERWKDFRMQSQKHSAFLDDEIMDNAKEKNKFFQFLDEMRSQVQSDLISHKQKTNCFLDALMEEQKSLLKDFSNQLNEKTTNEIRWANGLSEDMNSKKDDFVEMYEKFLTQRLPSLLNQLNSQTADMEAWVLNTHDNLHKQVSQHVHALETQIAQDKSSLSTLKNRFTSFHAQHNAEVLEYKRQIQSLSESQKDLDQLEVYLLNGAKLCAELKKKTETVELQNNCSNFEKSVFELNAAEESVNVLETGVKTREKEVTQITNIPEIIKLNEFNLIKDSSLQCHKSVSSEFDGFLKHSQKMQIDNCQEAKAALECHNTYVQENMQNNECTVNTISTSLSSKIAEEKTCLDENVQSLEVILNRSKDCSVTERKRSSEADSQLKKGILKYDLEIEKFYSEDLVKDIPTGTTPQRKSYDYPRKLITSSPAERVLQRFHSQLAVDTAVAINLPLDNSFNESEELKSSDGSAANSHDVSFISEACDSDGCESDSSAVSDISTDSKNKENYKRSKKTSRLPKRTQQFKGFLKPAPISNKKPLLTSNPDANSRT